MQVKDLKAGDNIEVIELRAKNVSQGKIGKSGTPYQHCWLTDGTADIRFSLFGDDVNKIREGQTVEIISAYVKEYPAGSGKLQLALSRDGGTWQIVDGQAMPTRREDIAPAPVQIVSSDARDNRISKLACLKAAAEYAAGRELTSPAAVLDIAQSWYDWVVEKEPSSEKSPEKKSAGEPTKQGAGTGPQATKLKLIADAALKENAGWTGPPTTDMIQKFAPLLNELLGGDDARHLWLKWTYGVESSKELTGAKVQVVFDMLQPTYADKKWVPTKNAEVFKAMYKQALKDAGFKESVEELYDPQDDIPF